MAKKKIEGILGGLADLVEKLGELAEKGEKLSRTKEFSVKEGERELKGIYGFSVKVGLGREEVEVEPFGNIRRDAKTGHAVFEEVREPVVDVFEEEGYTLVVAELPGISKEDVSLKIEGEMLTIEAEKGKKKYRKELRLPRQYSLDDISYIVNNGILEIKCKG